jgi:ER lumen protein retaining receptor
MNIFTIIGDLLHLFSILVILLKIYTTKSCKGISLKTQALYLAVFICRYLDLFDNFSSIYNWIMKVIFISTSAAIVYLITMHEPIKSTYDKKEDNFFVPYLIVPCVGLAFLTTAFYDPREILWTFSIWLESVAIVPQLVVVHSLARSTGGFVENLTADYVFTLGGYRLFYLINWIYRLLTEKNYSNWVSWIAGILQTAIYCDFFYYYASAKLKGEKMTLPI